MSLRDSQVAVSSGVAAPRDAAVDLPADPRFLAAVLDGLPVLAAWLDASCRYRYVNKMCEQKFGRPAHDLVGRHLRELIGEQAFADCLPSIMQALKGEIVRYEREAELLHLGRRHVTTTYIPYQPAGETVQGFVALVVDDTEARRQALVHAERVEVLSASVHDADTERRRAEALLGAQKRVLERMTQGAPLSEILELLVSSVEVQSVSPVRASIMLVENGVLRCGAAPRLPAPVVQALEGRPLGPTATACGAAAWFKRTVVIDDIASAPECAEVAAIAGAAGLRAAFAVPIVDSNGGVLATFGIYSPQLGPPAEGDLAMVRLMARTAGIAIERSRVEEALRRHSRITQTITDNAASCLFLLDAEGRPTYMNPSAGAVTGFELHEIVTRPLHDTLHGEEPEACALRLAMESGRPLRDFETTMGAKDGHVFPVVCHFAPLHEHGQGGGGVLEFRDVTEHRLARELQETNRRLNELNRLKSEFVSTMSHELRTPLNSIIGFTEVLLEELSGPVNDVQRRQLRLVAEAGNDLLKLISDILELSSIEAGKSTLQVTSFPLGECLLSCLASLRPAAEAKGLALASEGLDGIGELISDSRRVRQICLNLLSNAVKFTARGVVTVSAHAEGATVVVRVRDTGSGIAEERLPLLFQAFSRTGGDPTQEGAGLGLYISRQLATVLGGTLDLASRVGEGTTLTLVLPRHYTPALG